MTGSTDITDSKRDQERLQSDEAVIDMPEVKDIPGQENIHPPVYGEMADTTISSGDEEGDGLLDDLNDEDEEDESLDGEEMENDSDVSATEKQLLRDAANLMPTGDEDDIRNATLDGADDEGEPLNEESSESGADLDVPGSELDDADEEVGDEDEENNNYSLAQK